MYLLCMIKARIRWCTCRVENILTLGKLLSLRFCFFLHSILFLISQISYRTYKIISSYELARPIMGTIFLDIKNKIEWRRKQNHRLNNLPKVKIFSTLQVHHLILAFIINNIYISNYNYLYTYIVHTCIIYYELF